MDWRFIEIAKRYKEAGVDIFHVSSGGEAPPGSKLKPASHPGYQIPFARAYKQALDVPVIAVGRLDDPLLVEATLANEDAGPCRCRPWNAERSLLGSARH